MELWFSDYHTEKVKVSVKVQKQLFGLQTEFQRIDVFDSDEFGRFLSADGSIVFSEKDEFIYDEMIVHVPMAVHPHVKNVLVIGGGDGGVARELGYYEENDIIITEIVVSPADHGFNTGGPAAGIVYTKGRNIGTEGVPVLFGKPHGQPCGQVNCAGGIQTVLSLIISNFIGNFRCIKGTVHTNSIAKSQRLDHFGCF